MPFSRGRRCREQKTLHRRVKIRPPRYFTPATASTGLARVLFLRAPPSGLTFWCRGLIDRHSHRSRVSRNDMTNDRAIFSIVYLLSANGECAFYQTPARGEPRAYLHSSESYLLIYFYNPLNSLIRSYSDHINLFNATFFLCGSDGM